MATLTGKTLGKYTLGEQLGHGGMAEVYRAHHPVLDRDVTIKVLHGFLGGEDFLARFKREARAVASLRHAHIQQIHDFDFDGDHYYMVMEFIDWGTLQDLMLQQSREGRYLPSAKVLSIMEQVASALDYAHSRGIIHRDIKPSNILLDSGGNAFLSDFGIARMMGVTQFTATGSLIGTPTYMSPEQCRGEELSPSSDIYSLGIILYEMLTGKVPFTSETTPLAILHKHLTEPPPAPRSLRPDLPVDVEQIVIKALAKDPRDRYPSAGDLARVLKKALDGEAAAVLDAAAAPGSVPGPSRPTELIETPSPDRAERPTEMVEAVTPDWANLPTIPTGLVQAPKTPPPPAPPAGEDKAKGNGPATKRLLLWIALGLLGVLVIAGALIKIVPAMRPSAPVPTPDMSLPSSTPNPMLDTALPSSTRAPMLNTSLPSPTPTATTSETPTPLPGPVFYDNFSTLAYDGSYNPDLWAEWENGASNIAFTQKDGMLSMQQTGGVAALIASNYSNMHLAAPMYIEAKVKLGGQAGHAYVAIMEANFGVICSLYTSGQKGSVLCYDPSSSTHMGELPVDSSQDWHDIRLVVYPDSMTFTAFVDGQPLFSAVPPGALKYLKSAFSFRIGLYDSGTASGYFKEVMIGHVGK